MESAAAAPPPPPPGSPQPDSAAPISAPTTFPPPPASSPPLSPSPDSSAAAEEDTFARGAGLNLHYVAQGAGPAMLLLHGFPDDHRAWRPLLPALSRRFRCIAPDLRGYTGSDKPRGIEHYRMDRLVADAVALLDYLGQRDVILVGHDWGAAIAQQVALHHPGRVRQLVLLNMPHLAGLQRELAINRRQQAASWYARLFQDGLIERPLDWRILWRQLRGGSPQGIAFNVLRRSSVAGLLDYYRANYPRPPYRFTEPGPEQHIRVPTLMVFGMDDPFVLPECLDDNARCFPRGLTIVKVPRAGHWVHHDQPATVARAILEFARLVPSRGTPGEGEGEGRAARAVELTIEN